MNVRQARAETKALAQRCEVLMLKFNAASFGEQQACAKSIFDGFSDVREALLSLVDDMCALEDEP